MSASVVSYHLPQTVQHFIAIESSKTRLPKGRFLSFLIEDYKKTKEENLTLKSYFDMATDRNFLQTQIEENEEDFRAEIANNPHFYD